MSSDINDQLPRGVNSEGVTFSNGLAHNNIKPIESFSKMSHSNQSHNNKKAPEENFIHEKSYNWWVKIIDDYEATGLSAAAYCRVKKIQTRTFYNWRSKILQKRMDSKVESLAQADSKQSDSNHLKSNFVALGLKNDDRASFFTTQIFNDPIGNTNNHTLCKPELPDPQWLAELISHLVFQMRAK